MCAAASAGLSFRVGVARRCLGIPSGAAFPVVPASSSEPPNIPLQQVGAHGSFRQSQERKDASPQGTGEEEGTVASSR